MFKPATLTRLRKLARKNQFMRNTLRRAYRFTERSLARFLIKLRRADIGPLYIDPHAVRYTISRHAGIGNTVWHFGTVSAGDWDLDGYLVQERGQIYSILRQRVQEGAAYENIPEFMQDVERIESGEFMHSSSTRQEYYARWRRIEDLYWNIQQNGYKSQGELSTHNLLDEIRIQIGRQGELLFEEGRHRLLIAQLLNLDRVPALVTRRHQEWDRLRQNVIKLVLQRGVFCQAFHHPDLDFIPQKYENHIQDKRTYGSAEWDLILNTLPVNSGPMAIGPMTIGPMAIGTVLDTGAYWGYFVHRFEDLGFQCYAVEPDPDYLAVLNSYRQMTGKKFVVWAKPLFEIDRFDFDIILALGVFRRLAQTRRDHERLGEFLRKIRCQAMYFAPGEPLPGAYKVFSEQEFIDFIIDNSILAHARLLAPAPESGNIYLLTARQ